MERSGWEWRAATWESHEGSCMTSHTNTHTHAHKHTTARTTKPVFHRVLEDHATSGAMEEDKKQKNSRFHRFTLCVTVP